MCDSLDDDTWDAPFMEAFEEDTETFPFGTLSKTASHVTTLPSTTDAAVSLSNTTHSTIFVDLGCGVGRVTNRARDTTGCTAVGVDMCPNEIAQAQELANGNGAIYLVDDVFNAEAVIAALPDFTAADWDRVVIFIFLIPTLVNSTKFQALLGALLDKGAKLVSYCYHPDKWTPHERDERMNVNLYRRSL